MTSPSPHNLTRYIILGMVSGGVTGWLFGPQTVPLGIVGTMFIQLIKMLAIPLVLMSILDAILSTNLSWKTASRWCVVILINTTCALLIGLSLSNLFQPGEGFVSVPTALHGGAPPVIKEFSLASFIHSLIPTSLLEPFVENNVLSVVLLAILFGSAMRTYAHQPGAEISLDSARRVARAGAAVVSHLILWLVTLVPVAVFCVTARTVGEHGFAPLRGLALYVILVALGLLIHVLIVYSSWIMFIGKLSLAHFYKVAHKPIVYAFGTNSSLATVPVTLEALDTLKVPKAASRLGTCIGTNFNNDGIILYEAMAVLFVAQALGVELSVGEQIFAACMSLLAAMGVAGVPEAGVVSLSLVLTAVGLPLEMVPLLLTVDWIVARLRSVVNVMSDMTVSIAIAGLLPLSQQSMSHEDVARR